MDPLSLNRGGASTSACPVGSRLPDWALVVRSASEDAGIQDHHGSGLPGAISRFTVHVPRVYFLGHSGGGPNAPEKIVRYFDLLSILFVVLSVGGFFLLKNVGHWSFGV
ncbi:MAG: hypothetical protein DHS20C21_09930 [Gemmatimonadota bacterium]|nr:MAG: hypothetical protein DHS20C21_09930 [Gemmatimonadota bacterium]